VTHSESGWINGEIAAEYIYWLKELYPTHPLALLWDVYPAHTDADVRAVAQEEAVCLAYVPSGQTSIWQPLDRRIFGSLKQRAKALFRMAHSDIHGAPPKLDIFWALYCLVTCWDAIPNEDVKAAWNIFD
jgi:hypothetical protein